MTKDAFKERERALEEEFFHRVDKKLLENLKGQLTAEAERKRLAAATGFSDEDLLQALVDQGVSAEAMAAMTLVPLVLVAWADGTVDDKERPSLLKAAQELGIEDESVAGKLFAHWLNTKPDPRLASTWQHYTRVATENMNTDSKTAFRDKVLRRARAVAKASGGSLGFGTVSAEEKRVIAELEGAFDTE